MDGFALVEAQAQGCSVWWLVGVSIKVQLFLEEVGADADTHIELDASAQLYKALLLVVRPTAGQLLAGSAPGVLASAAAARGGEPGAGFTFSREAAGGSVVCCKAHKAIVLAALGKGWLDQDKVRLAGSAHTCWLQRCSVLAAAGYHRCVAAAHSPSDPAPPRRPCQRSCGRRAATPPTRSCCGGAATPPPPPGSSWRRCPPT
jgi:hypothetical protein